LYIILLGLYFCKIFIPASVVPPLTAIESAKSLGSFFDFSINFTEPKIVNKTISLAIFFGNPICCEAFSHASISLKTYPGPLPEMAVALSISISFFNQIVFPTFEKRLLIIFLLFLLVLLLDTKQLTPSPIKAGIFGITLTI